MRFSVLLALLPLGFAAPAPGLPTSLAALKSASLSDLALSTNKGCSVADISIPLPSGLTANAGQKVSLVTVGRGTQNYTCTSGQFVSAGAIANLYDASCILSFASRFTDTATISNVLTVAALKGLSYPNTPGLPVAVHHFFVNTPGATSGISPEFASSTDHVILSKDSSVDATNPTVNVAYLKLNAVAGQGTLASTVFRLNTQNGQPPSSCTTEGEVKTVDYAAMYWFTK